MSVALIRGMQGDDPKYWQAASLMKHFLANSNETTRGGSSSNFDERLLREYYAFPFRAGFLEGGAKSFMAAYNAWNHIPMTVHPILRSIVAKEWGADGIVSSDATAVSLMFTQHKYFQTEEQATAAAIRAGIGQILSPRAVPSELVRKALAAGLLTETDLNEVLRGKFRTVIRLGLLDPSPMVPYAKIGAEGEPEPWTTEKQKAVARAVAHESIVLLKNAGGLLPLDRGSLKSVAVIGPRAGEVLVDLYGGTLPYSISVLDGLKNKLGPDIRLQYAPNNENDAAVKAAKSSDVAIVVVGNHPFCGVEANMRDVVNPDTSTKPCADPGEGREGRDRESLELSQESLIRQVFAVNRKTVVVLLSSFPYAINWTQQNVPAILHATHAAQEQGSAIADVLFGDYNPAGRLNQTWPKSVDQLPPMNDYNIRNGHTYMYFKGEPLYPFGYGLSYTTFHYSKLRFSAPRLRSGDEMMVSIDVSNTGSRAGDEVVQLYVKHLASHVQRPIKELKGFNRATLKPKETKTVQIPLKAESLAYWDEHEARWKVEDEPVLIMVGGSSAHVAAQRTIAVGR
jgi:beta-glucosidase